MKIGMIFPGYGNQFVGMAKDLYDEHRIIQEYFEEAYNCLNLNFIKLCFASSDSELSKIINAYTSIFLTSASLNALLKENNIKPDIVAGYGIGFYAAAFSAGGLTFPDGLYLLRKFATFFEEYLAANNDNSVIKINGIPTNKLKKICENFKSLKFCSYDSQLQHLISGHEVDINELKAFIKDEHKIKGQIIDPAIGLHSDLMNDIAQQLTIYLQKVDFKDTQIPIISSIDAKEIYLGKKIKDNIIKQISSPIKWNKVIDKFKDVDLIILVGPGNSFIDQLKETYIDKKIVSFNNKSDFQEIKQILDSQKITQEIKEEHVATVQ